MSDAAGEGRQYIGTSVCDAAQRSLSKSRRSSLQLCTRVRPSATRKYMSQCIMAHMMPPSTASPELLASIGLDPVRFCRWREEFTFCDRAATDGDVHEWASVLREYMHHLRFLRRPSTTIDPDFDRDAALLLLASEGGLTRAAAENVVRYRERLWDEDAEEEKRYFGHFMASQLAMSYVEGMLNEQHATGGAATSRVA